MRTFTETDRRGPSTHDSLTDPPRTSTGPFDTDCVDTDETPADSTRLWAWLHNQVVPQYLITRVTLGAPSTTNFVNPQVPHPRAEPIDASAASADPIYTSLGGPQLTPSKSQQFFSYITIPDPFGNIDGTYCVDINNSGVIIGPYASGVYGYAYQDGIYTTIRDPAASSIYPNSFPLRINSTGQMVGFYTDDNRISHIFLYNSGTYTEIDPTGNGVLGANGDNQAFTVGINDFGVIFGLTTDSQPFAYDRRPFLYENGTYTILNVPGAAPHTQQFASGINNLGSLVGNYFDAAGAAHGFIYSGGTSGTYTTLDDPFASLTLNHGTFITDINNSGQIVGYYLNDTSQEHGFLYSGGQFFDIDDPLAVNGTYPVAINSFGQIAGNYFDTGGVQHGFYYSAGIYTTVDPSGSTYTMVEGMNDQSKIVGAFYNGSMSGGFEAIPTLTVGAVGGLQFDLTFDSTVSNVPESEGGPTAFQNAIIAACQFYSGHFSNPLKISLYIEWGNTTGSHTAESGASLAGIKFSYDQIKTALGITDSNSAVEGKQFTLTTAQAKALGISPTADSYYFQDPNGNITNNNGNLYDGMIDFSMMPHGFFWNFDPTNTFVSGQVPLVGAAAHEISEIMGRIQYQAQSTLGANEFMPYDLFRYLAPGNWDGAGTSGAYLSADGGTSNLNSSYSFYGGGTSEDFGDWAEAGDAFSGLPYYTDQEGNITSPAPQPVSAEDLQAVALAGWDLAPPCYCRGTLIRCDRGQIPIENLTIGDCVVTASGELKPIKWIGRRAYDARFIAGNLGILPIHIEADALADGVPARDLFVSPEHALVINGLFLPARTLLNGVSIRQGNTAVSVEYFHIELEQHDVIFAEGAPAETFVDVGGRRIFSNAAEFAVLYPDTAGSVWEHYSALLEKGRAGLPAIRAAVLARAKRSERLSHDPDLHLIIDGAVVRTHSRSERSHRFIVPAGARSVTIASRSVVPGETEPASFDQRRLGVPVQRVILSNAGVHIEIGPDSPILSHGFHRDEGSHRWTDGRALLPPQLLACFTDGFVLDVQIGVTELHYAVVSSMELAPASQRHQSQNAA